MLKILQVGLGPNPGGIENCIMNYYRHLDRENFHFDFADIYGQGLAYQEEMLALGSKVFTMPNYKQQPWDNFWEFQKIFSENSYDIMHINMLSAANIIPILAGKYFTQAKIIVHCHNSNVPGGTLRRLLNSVNRGLLRWLADKKLACGMLAGQWMWGSNFPKENIIYNAIDLDVYKPNADMRQAMRAKCSFTDRDIVLGFVGRLCEQKNPMFLLDILAELHKESAHYKLLIVGDGDYREQFENKLQALGLQPYVYMAGLQKSAADWYQAMDIFLLPSLFEGLPVVAIEAQAAGLQCIFSDNITKECALGNNVNFAGIKDTKQWYTLIKNMQMDNMGPTAQAYDIRENIKKLMDVYSSLVDKV